MDQAVKERADATPCLECGGPTWSHDGYCFKCRRARGLPPPTAPEQARPAPVEVLPQPKLDDAGRIDEEIPCRACGYLLQGLEPAGVCPECSTPIARSIHGDLLRFCDPDWLRRIASGLLIILLGCVALALFAFVFSFIMFGVAAAGGGANVTAVSVGMGAGGIGITAVIVLGVWWLTTPDPGHTGDEPPVTARKIARWCVLAQLVAAPLNFVGQTMTGTSPMNPMAALTTGAMLMAGLGMILGLVGQAGYVASLLYLRKLVRRVPRDSLGGQLKFIAWAYGVTQFGTVVFGIGTLLLMPSIVGGGATGPSISWAFWFFSLGGCTVLLGTIVFSIWALILVIIARSAIMKVAETARSTWGSENLEGTPPDDAV